MIHRPVGHDLQQQIQALTTHVQELVSTGAMTSGQGTVLQGKLNAANASLARDLSSESAGAAPSTSTEGHTAACHQVQAFVNQVRAFVRVGILTPAQGQPLINGASALITQLCG